MFHLIRKPLNHSVNLLKLFLAILSFCVNTYLHFQFFWLFSIWSCSIGTFLLICAFYLTCGWLTILLLLAISFTYFPMANSCSSSNRFHSIYSHSVHIWVSVPVKPLEVDLQRLCRVRVQSAHISSRCPIVSFGSRNCHFGWRVSSGRLELAKHLKASGTSLTRQVRVIGRRLSGWSQVQRTCASAYSRVSP